MNLPNKITLSRVVLALIFMIFFYLPGITMHYIAMALFIIANLTDMYDGYLARKTGVVTGFGKFMDPLADKILVSIVFLALLDKGILSAWIISLILVREFIITGIRTLAAYKGVAIQASRMAKLKTFIQLILASWGLCHYLFESSSNRILQYIFQPDFILYLSYAALLITYLSGYDYLIKSKKIFAGDL
ncbi:MAG: CDP-diacylglycerol--glycerol-3-phosphate 3-phosphatidyltransferase [Candidatus Delongbacteria bacterium]|nr:CDP-diacylglycerol--glycerol-3-phosphate 3-phosphatidyltransferase [Candidatus Delongbacteria bacterium]